MKIPISKLFVLIVTVVTILVVGTVFAIFTASVSSGQIDPEETAPPESSIQRSGTLVCLLHKDTSGPQTAECAIGLKTADGQHYSLSGLTQDAATTATGTAIEVTGLHMPAGTSDKYDTQGTIQVKDFQRL